MHFSPGIMKARVGTLLVAWALLCGAPMAQAADTERHVSVWIISPEGSGPNDIAQGEDIPSRMEALRLSLAGTRIRLLNVEDPLATKTGSWYPEYTVPNFQIVANQRKTFAALARFAEQNNAYVVLRLITWERGVRPAARRSHRRPGCIARRDGSGYDVDGISSCEGYHSIPARLANPQGKLAGRAWYSSLRATVYYRRPPSFLLEALDFCCA